MSDRTVMPVALKVEEDKNQVVFHDDGRDYFLDVTLKFRGGVVYFWFWYAGFRWHGHGATHRVLYAAYKTKQYQYYVPDSRHPNRASRLEKLSRGRHPGKRIY